MASSAMRKGLLYFGGQSLVAGQGASGLRLHVPNAFPTSVGGLRFAVQENFQTREIMLLDVRVDGTEQVF